jgi:hypothetical protein
MRTASRLRYIGSTGFQQPYRSLLFSLTVYLKEGKKPDPDDKKFASRFDEKDAMMSLMEEM